MRITIANRLHPFSHIPGTWTVLSGSELQVQIFPTLIRIYSQQKLVKDFPLIVDAPTKNFTVENDLERGVISVWWHTVNGFVRYRLFVNGSGMVRIEFDGGDQIDLYQTQKTIQPKIEKISFGVHKKQDFDMVRNRLNIEEIWPFWFQLGQLVPHASGTCDLLDLWRNEIKPEKIKDSSLLLFRAGFHGIMTPSLIDDQHQGIQLNGSGSPLVLLSEGAAIIRSHLFRSEENQIYILPLLPPELHCGRMTNVQFEGAALDFEWSKKNIRRMVLHTHQDQERVFHFRHCKQFRLRKSYKDKGIVAKSGEILSLDKNCDYFFDNFS